MDKRAVIGVAVIIGLLVIGSVVWGDGAAASSPGDRIAIGAPARGTRAGFVLEAGTWIRQLIRPGTGPGALALIIAAATAYGILHALGPGHQKSLLAGVFLSDGGTMATVAKGAAIAAASHALSVIALFGGLALLGGGLTLARGDAAGILVARISGIILLGLAIRMLYMRIRAAIRHHGALSATRTDASAPSSASACDCGHHHVGHDHPDSPDLPVKRVSMTTIIAGSLVPCPGAAFFMLYGFSVGNPLAGILAVLAISAGMWITLFGVGIAVIKARALGERLGRKADGTSDPGTGVKASRGLAAVRSSLEVGGAVIVLVFALGLML